MKRLIINFVTILILCYHINAQQVNQICGTQIPSQQWENEFQKLIDSFKSTFLNNGNIQSTDYTIPVIFHIIHGGQPPGTFPNLLQGQINSQITVLNQDLSGIGLNAWNYPVNAFIQWAINQNLPQLNLDSLGRVKIADLKIKFCLAEKDTLGNTLPEPGIDRINFITKGWSNPNTFITPAALRSYFDGTIKPQSIWSTKKYLNIWVSDKNNAVPYTGFSTLPPLSGLPGITGGGEGTDSTDGVWCYTSALGSSTIFPAGIYASPNVKGRTVTHEVGHYLGMRHIWGDGNCATDYCADTPPAFTSNVGFPVYPLNPGSCNSPSNTPNGEMFMNFMDYSADPAKYMFTIDQFIRAQTAMMNSPLRNQLGLHGLCTVVIGINEGEISGIPVEFLLSQNYPNPFNPNTKIYFDLPENTFVKITIYDIEGKEIEILVNQFIRQGRYEINWNADNYSSGIYLYTMETGSFKQTKRMALIK